MLSALAFAAALALPAAGQERLEPGEAEVLADLVLASPGYKEQYEGASEAERAAARVQLLDWMRTHPDDAGHLLSGFLIDERFPSSRFRDKFNELVAGEKARLESPGSAVRALEQAASESARIQQSFHLSDDEIRTWTHEVFEKESEKGVLSGFTVAAPGGERRFYAETPDQGLRLNPKAFRDVEREGSGKLRELESELDQDRAASAQGALKVPGLHESLERRADDLSRARESLRAFEGVLARRPEAVKSLTRAELQELDRARAEAGRRLALAALAAREFDALREAAELGGPELEKALAGLPVGDGERKAYREALAAKSRELAALAARWSALRSLLESPDYASRLADIRRGAAEAERLARAIEDRSRLAHSVPFQYYNEHARNRLSWLERLWRWLVLTFLPRSRWAQAYKRGEAREALAAAAFRSIAGGAL